MFDLSFTAAPLLLLFRLQGPECSGTKFKTYETWLATLYIRLYKVNIKVTPRVNIHTGDRYSSVCVYYTSIRTRIPTVTGAAPLALSETHRGAFQSDQEYKHHNWHDSPQTTSSVIILLLIYRLVLTWWLVNRNKQIFSYALGPGPCGSPWELCWHDVWW